MRYVRKRWEHIPSSLTVNTGTLAAGTVADLAETNGTAVQITEVVGTPGYDVEIGWTGISFLEEIAVKGHYSNGTNTHNLYIDFATVICSHL